MMEHPRLQRQSPRRKEKYDITKRLLVSSDNEISMETNDSKWERRRENVELRDLLSSNSSTGGGNLQGASRRIMPLEKVECCNETTLTGKTWY
jgi:hypothetical protein